MKLHMLNSFISTPYKACDATSRIILKCQSEATTFPSSIPFVLLSTLAISISYADRSNLSTAVIPMAAAFHWDSFFSGLVLSAFWFGYALTQYTGGALADKFGGEKVLLFSLMAWSVCTALTPTAAFSGNTQLIATRVLLGAGEGFALPAIHSMTRKYVAASDRSISTSVITGGCYVGALLANLIAPTVIDKYGWEACFWGFAALPASVWLPLWLRFMAAAVGEPSEGQVMLTSVQNVMQNIVESEASKGLTAGLLSGQESDSDSGGGGGASTYSATASAGTSNLTTNTVGEAAPRSNSNPLSPISSDGFTEISSTESRNSDQLAGTEDDSSVATIRQLLLCKPVWAIILAQYCSSWGMVGILSWLPSYFSEKYAVPVASLGSYTVLPYFLQMVISVSAGYAADYLMSPKVGMRVLQVRNIMQISGMLLPALFLTICALSPDLSVDYAAGLITAGSALSALTVAGVSCSQFDISPRNAGAIFGIGNTASCFAGAIAVPVSGWLYDVTDSWGAVFLLFAVHYIAGSLAWLLLASDKRLSFNTRAATQF